MTPWTSVVSYHTDPETCGVARFSAQLAQRLGVELVGIGDRSDCWGDHPLLSIKFSEWQSVLSPTGIWSLRRDQLWHDAPPAWYQATGRVWKLYDIGVPALVERVDLALDWPAFRNTRRSDALQRAFFTFGMAHKIDLDRFLELKRQHPQMHLWVSAAPHEGSDRSRVKELLRAWGPGAFDLGHLSDAALRLVWWHVSAFVAFFEQGLRANNSSVHAALDARVPVITNHGVYTPADLKAITMDYRWAAGWESEFATRPGPSPYTWPRLLKELGCDTDS
jgi:hypothetical protein